MEKVDATFVCRATQDESSEIKLLIGRCKENYSERAIEVLIKALKYYKENKLTKGDEVIG